jgi:hypothetical protein
MQRYAPRAGWKPHETGAFRPSHHWAISMDKVGEWPAGKDSAPAPEAGDNLHMR